MKLIGIFLLVWAVGFSTLADLWQKCHFALTASVAVVFLVN
jgi:hypothetical protein